MVHSKKTKWRKERKIIEFKNILIVVIFVFIVLIALQIYLSQSVDILYFRDPNCFLVYRTDLLLNDVKKEFGNMVKIKEINVSMYTDELVSEEVKRLKEKYKVYGVPDIIINGKKFTKKFTKDNLIEEICNNFKIKPLVCL